MVKFYKAVVVIEAQNPLEASLYMESVVQAESGTNDLWLKDIEEMTDEEILEFFDKTREEMESGQ